MWPPLLALLLPACSDYGLGSPEKEGGDTGYVHQEDTFVVPPMSGVDVIMFGDTSDSMQPRLEALGVAITDFVAGLSTWTDDWHLLAVTGPDGCGVGGTFTPETPDYAAAFATAILTRPGADLVDEWGLADTAAAVEATDPGECNDGFLREDAPLQIVFFSDEGDSSPGWDVLPDTYWQSYVDAVKARKSAAGVEYSAVVGPVPDGCAGATPGTGYASAVEATGGELLSICDAWETQLELIAGVPVRMSAFPLSLVPVPETIQVWVNGSMRTDGWTWDADPNEVTLTEDPPTSGDEVMIRYQVDE